MIPKLSTETRKAIAEHTSKPIRMLFAEDFDKLLEDHRKVCTDLKCDESQLAVSFQGEIVTPMVRVGSPKELFLTIDSEPFQSVQLTTGDEIKDFFNANGKEVIACECGDSSRHKLHAPSDVVFLHPGCHQGHSIVMVPLSNGRVQLACKTCYKSVLGPLQAAPRPTTEAPFIFCDYHGKQHGYFGCRHVLEGQEPAILNRATDTTIGLAACHKCEKLLHLPLKKVEKHKDKFGVVCAGHLNDRVNGKLEQFLSEAEAVVAKPVDVPFSAGKVGA
jgi:hypothetical protein